MEFRYQYDLVRSSRAALLGYCRTLSEADFVAEHSAFGSGSVRNLLVHIANTYEFWIGQQVLREDIVFTPYGSVYTVADAEVLFDKIDALVGRFIDAVAADYLKERALSIRGTTVPASPLKVFTHVITHEFHHKGQLLSLSRQLGYVPVDTDVIR